jgi:hypothetical protein
MHYFDLYSANGKILGRLATNNNPDAGAGKRRK